MKEPTRRRVSLPLAGCLVAAIGLAGAGAVGLPRAGAGTVADTVTVDEVPLLVVSPADRPAPASGRPGAVVVHGFAGSARLMRGLADTLAGRGYVVALPDLAGHGASTRRFPAAVDGAAAGTLRHDLAVAVRHLRGLPSVDPSRIVLVGHSMGAGAVVRYASAHPEIRATVAVSLGSADDLPDDPARPRNLLLVVGAAEFPPFLRAALAGVRTADPTASFGATTGDPDAGTARRAVRVPGTEHISVLYATRTHAEMVAWLDPVVVAPAGGPVRPRDRLVPSALLLLAFGLGFVPLAGLLPRAAAPTAGPTAPTAGPAAPTAGPISPPRRIHARYAYPGLFAALALAVAGAGVVPTGRLPLAVGGYASGFFAIVGAGLVGAYLAGRRVSIGRVPAPATGPRRGAVGLLLVGYAAAAVAVPLHLGVTHAVPVGARWWLLPLVVGSVALLLTGVDLVAGDSRWRGPFVLAATAGALLAAAAAGTAPGFVLLVAPLLAVLFAWHIGWSSVLRRRCAPRWLPAIVGATVVGWPIAVTLPVTG